MRGVRLLTDHPGRSEAEPLRRLSRSTARGVAVIFSSTAVLATFVALAIVGTASAAGGGGAFVVSGSEVAVIGPTQILSSGPPVRHGPPPPPALTGGDSGGSSGCRTMGDRGPSDGSPTTTT